MRWNGTVAKSANKSFHFPHIFFLAFICQLIKTLQTFALSAIIIIRHCTKLKNDEWIFRRKLRWTKKILKAY